MSPKYLPSISRPCIALFSSSPSASVELVFGQAAKEERLRGICLVDERGCDGLGEFLGRGRILQMQLKGPRVEIFYQQTAQAVEIF